MGRIYIELPSELSGKSSSYTCARCGVVLATRSGLVSRAFHGRGGKAYLFNVVYNVTLGHLEDRALMTGVHAVADVNCCGCAQVVGWTYVFAADPTQRHKHGKTVLERAQLHRAKADDAASSGEDA